MEEILNRLKKLETLTLIGSKNVLTLDEVCFLTGLAKSSIYKMTANRVIPHYRADGGKHIYFRKDEVEEWLTRNRVSSQDEDEQKAINEHFCNRVKKGGLQ